MMRRTERTFLTVATVITACLGAGRSASADPSLTFQAGSSSAITISNATSATYYVGEFFGQTVVSASSTGFEEYKISVSLTDNSPGTPSSAQLIDSAVTVSRVLATAGNLRVTISDNTFTNPVGSNLNLQSVLHMTSVLDGSGNPDKPTQGDPDAVSAFGSFNNTNTNSVSGNENQAGQDIASNKVSVNHLSGAFTLSNTMNFQIGQLFDVNQITAKNTVTLTATATPEPSTLAMAFGGAVVFAGAWWRRKRAA